MHPIGAPFTSLLYSHFTHDCITKYDGGDVALQLARRKKKKISRQMYNNESLFMESSSCDSTGDEMKIMMILMLPT